MTFSMDAKNDLEKQLSRAVNAALSDLGTKESRVSPAWRVGELLLQAAPVPKVVEDALRAAANAPQLAKTEPDGALPAGSHLVG